jgi:AAA domain
MKIAFTGAQCTGKSTQVRLLKDYHIVESASRFVAKEGMPVNRQGDLSSQIVITGRMELDLHRTKEIENVVWERTHIDSYAYASVCKIGPAKDSYLDMVEQLARKQFEEYFQLVFFFPAYDLCEFVNVEDGTRDCEETYRTYIGNNIQDMLDFFQVPYLTIPRGTITERHAFIEEQIKLAENRPVIERLSNVYVD